MLSEFGLGLPRIGPANGELFAGKTADDRLLRHTATALYVSHKRRRQVIRCLLCCAFRVSEPSQAQARAWLPQRQLPAWGKTKGFV